MTIAVEKKQPSFELAMQYHFQTGNTKPNIVGSEEIVEYVEWLENTLDAQLEKRRKLELEIWIQKKQTQE